jgi:hypothetical protein
LHYFRLLLLAFLLPFSFGFSQNSSKSKGKQYLRFLKESRTEWKLLQHYNFRAGYDSNINHSFDTPPLAVNAKTPNYYSNISLMMMRLFPKKDTSLSFSLNGFYDGFTKYHNLNIANMTFTSRVAHFLSKKFMLGTSLSIHIHHQPFLQDYALRLQATDFSNHGYHLHPFIAFYPAETLSIFISFDFEHSQFKKAREPLLYPYTFYKKQIDLEILKKNDSWGTKLYASGEDTKYASLPSFSESGILFPNNPKEHLVDTKAKYALWKNFPGLIPEISMEYGHRKDKFEDYDTYDFYKPELIFTVPITKSHRFQLQGSYENRKYKKRPTSLGLIDSTKVKYKIYHSSFLHEWNFYKGFQCYESFTWDERKTNVSLLPFDRNYKQFIGMIGIKISI